MKTCVSACSFGIYRGPGSSIVSSVCNVQCDSNSFKCSNMSSTEVIALNRNYSCQPGFDRVGYNCVERSKALKSNNCLHLLSIKFEKLFSLIDK